MDGEQNQTNTQQIQNPNEEPAQEQPDRKSQMYKPQFDWNLQNFDEQSALKDLSRLANQNLAIQQQKSSSKFYIAESTIKSMTLNKQHFYIIRGENEQNQKFQIIRKYSDFHALREVLVKRWPGCFIPPIPQGNIGATQKQVFKNKLLLVNSFISRMLINQPIYKGQQFQIFIKSPENQVQKNLNQLKPHSLQDLYGIYKGAWPEQFKQINEIELQHLQQKIKKFQDYFGQAKKDLAKQKDEIKRLAELRTKLTAQRYHVLQKILPQYQQICLGWFSGKNELPGQQKPQQENKQQNQQNKQEQIIEQNTHEISNELKIFSHQKYQSALQAYKFDLFPAEEGENDDWLIYQQFKYQLREIQAILQAITTYKYLLSQKRFYQRNIEGNKQQLEDINNKKVSIKILFLSGSEDEKKTQLANQTQVLQGKYKLSEQLWSAITQRVVSEIQNFQIYRCQYYKKNLMRAFKKQAVYMAKLFNLYVEIHKL